ncbi:MAG: DUF1592 domain-containing protein [Vicinamibacterales bacterium]
MKKVAAALAALVVPVAVSALRAAEPPGAGGQAPRPAASHAPAAAPGNETIQTYCVGCHNDRAKAGDLSLAAFDVSRAADHAEVAEKVIRKLRTGMMPPRTASRKLDPATRTGLADALETRIDRAAAATRNPGRRSFQRLNRAEYAAAVRSLFGLDIDVSSYLPADTISASFDNIADVQMPSATVMQGYMRAAAHVSRVAVGDPAADPSSTQYDVPRTLSQKERLDGAPFGTRGGTVVTHNFPADGQYKFQMLLHGEPTGYLFGRTQRDIEMEVAIDGERVALVQVDRWMSESDPDGLTLSTDPIYVRAGAHTVAATFLQEFEGAEDDLIKPIDHTLADTQIGVGYGVTTLAHLRNLSVVGPFEATGVSDHPARRAIFSCRPTAPGEDVACARSILQRLATQAYRRPASAKDVDQLMTFYDAASKRDGFEAGIRQSLQALLTSLHFVFRVEETPAGVAPGAPYRITDIDLASRLSFFLWGTLPDKELLDVAARGGLSRPEMSSRQVRRMLDDPKAAALGTRFAAQWLRLQDLTKVEPDALSFPYFDESLADAMARETELLFNHLVREDRPATELLTADYTFVNERLARHYGIPGVSGPEFRKVSYPDEHRRGLLGHGSVLTLTSHGNRTSPVLRGKWVMEVLLGSPPPAPPPNVPQLDATAATSGGRNLSVAEQMAQHRASPVCSSCHNVIDPIGLSLDNFDPTGAWRIKDRGVPVNTTGELYDGSALQGVADLRAAIVARSDVFVTHFTERLLSYALGRRVEYFDMPTVRQIVKDARAQDYRMSALLRGVVQSAAFRMASADQATNEEPR